MREAGRLDVDGKQRQAEIAHPDQDAVEGRLIDDRTGKERVPVSLVDDGATVEPAGPCGVAVPANRI